MILKSISSSSKGNLHILSNNDTTIILDCGIKYARIAKYLNDLRIDGVLLTHEHGDHINGCKTLNENKDTIFYSSKETLELVDIPDYKKISVEPLKTFSIGTFSVTPFDVSHDAVHPVNYLIKDKQSGLKFLYITDTGYVDNLKFKDINYYLVECNFDENWYSDETISSLPYDEAKERNFRKKRLLSSRGHLSIQKTLSFLKRNIDHNCRKIILCHISHSYKDYMNFQKVVSNELNLNNIIALDPSIIDIRINELYERKDVIKFE